MDFWILYTSHADPKLSEQDLEAILKAARKTNKELEITGLLLKRNGYFIQLLEGPIANAKKVYSKILKDKRHSQLNLLLESAAPSRLFPTWQMGYIDAPHTAEDLLSHVKSAMQGSGDLRDRVLGALQVFSDQEISDTRTSA